jgi:hypothetical protein
LNVTDASVSGFWARLSDYRVIDAAYFLAEKLRAHPPELETPPRVLAAIAKIMELTGARLPGYDFNMSAAQGQDSKYRDRISRAELDRCAQVLGVTPLFPDDSPGVADGTPERFAPPGVNARPPKLEALNRAWDKWWGNADRDDRSTHRGNEEVAAWLVEQGFSVTLAEKGASIIRPDWAPTGRKPDE